jgi:hypothetical protein
MPQPVRVEESDSRQKDFREISYLGIFSAKSAAMSPTFVKIEHKHWTLYIKTDETLKCLAFIGLRKWEKLFFFSL